MRLALRLAAFTTALALAMAGCGNGHSASTSASRFDGAALPPGVRAPGFTLTDQHGHSVSLSSYRDQVVALVFLPSPSCRACVLVAQQVRGALDELGAEQSVHTIFVSAVPRPRRRARVAQLFSETSLSGRAVYLTGTPMQLRPAWRAYHVANAEDAVMVILIDRAGFERVAFGLEQVTPESLAHDIRLLSGSWHDDKAGAKTLPDTLAVR